MLSPFMQFISIFNKCFRFLLYLLTYAWIICMNHMTNVYGKYLLKDKELQLLMLFKTF